MVLLRINFGALLLIIYTLVSQIIFIETAYGAEDCDKLHTSCIQNLIPTECDQYSADANLYAQCEAAITTRCDKMKNECAGLSDCKDKFSVCESGVTSYCVEDKTPVTVPGTPEYDGCLSLNSSMCLVAQTECNNAAKNAPPKDTSANPTGQSVDCDNVEDECKAEEEAKCSAISDPSEQSVCMGQVGQTCSAKKSACELEQKKKEQAVQAQDDVNSSSGGGGSGAGGAGQGQGFVPQLGHQDINFGLESLEGDKLVNPLGGSNDNPEGLVNINELIGKLIAIGMGMLGALSLLAFIWGGFLWMTSRGNVNQVQKGTKTMLYAGLGIVLIFSSYALVTFLIGAIGG